LSAAIASVRFSTGMRTACGTEDRLQTATCRPGQANLQGQDQAMMDNMQQVAAEEKCAFFDMTGPRWTDIQDSGKTYGWFRRDAVHANSRGCQIIGRLPEIWFKESGD
jgi:hypothetical protein